MSVRTDGGSGNVVRHSAFEGGNNSSSGSYAVLGQYPIQLVYCKMSASSNNNLGGTTSAIRLDHGSGNSYIDHVDVLGTHGIGIYQHGAGTTYVRNSIIAAGNTGETTEAILQDGGTITVSNSISVRNNVGGDVWGGTVTDGGNNITQATLNRSAGKDLAAVLYTYAAYPGDYYGRKIYGAGPDIGAIEFEDVSPGSWFFEFFSPPILNLCASTNAACYIQP